MFMDCIRKQTYQCAQHKLKIVTKKHDSRNTLFGMFIFVFDNKTKFMGTHAVVLVKTFPLAHHLL